MVARRALVERHDFYVYVIFRPNGIPCYVGKGQHRRWLEHAKGSCNQHLTNIYKLAGGALPAIKIREDLTETEAFDIEKVFIVAIGRKTTGGPLVNLTDGGEGVSGMKQSEHAIATTRARFLGKKRGPMPEESRANLSAARKGWRASDDCKRAISAGLKGKPKPPGWADRLSRTMMGHVLSQSTKDKISVAMRGKKLSSAAAAAHSERMRSPELRERIRQTRLGTKASDETKAKMRSARIGKPMPVATRAAISAGWARRRERAEVL